MKWNSTSLAISRNWPIENQVRFTFDLKKKLDEDKDKETEDASGWTRDRCVCVCEKGRI